MLTAKDDSEIPGTVAYEAARADRIENKLASAKFALEGVKGELDAMAALKGFRFQHMRALIGVGLDALSDRS